MCRFCLYLKFPHGNLNSQVPFARNLSTIQYNMYINNSYIEAAGGFFQTVYFLRPWTLTFKILHRVFRIETVMWYFNVLSSALSFSWHKEQRRDVEVKMLT